MGQRTVMRVPRDFDWPQGQTWKGYEAPEWRSCPNSDCENGSTLSGRWLGCFAYLILMAGEAGQEGRLHPWLERLPLVPKRPPGADMTALSTGLAGRPPGPLGHDGIDQGMAMKAIAKAAGMLDGWGICQVCKGSAIHPDDKAAEEVWERIEPPAGDGWQLWETTSEGSPVSPVFATPEELARWCVDGATLFAGVGASYEEWFQMIVDDEVEIGSTMMFRSST
jgi:hypothetical protein